LRWKNVAVDPPNEEPPARLVLNIDVAIDLSFIHDLVAELYPQQRTTADRSNGDVTCSGPLGAPAVRSMSFLEPDLTDLVFDALRLRQNPRRATARRIAQNIFDAIIERAMAKACQARRSIQTRRT
jgi:hypothetical protein